MTEHLNTNIPLLRSQRSLYFDHNASSPVTADHWVELLEALSSQVCGNPSSPHAQGRHAQNLLSTARRAVAAAMSADPSEVVFLASATEANNTVIKGIVEAHSFPDERISPSSHPRHASAVHVVANACAHPSIREPLIQAERLGTAAVTWVPPDNEGTDYASAVLSALRPETKLVCLTSANNETGRTYPVAEIADSIHRLRFPHSRSSSANQGQGAHDKTRLKASEPMSISTVGGEQSLSQESLLALHLHVDATQSLGKCARSEWTSPGIDSLTVSGHKVGALPGSAALVIRRGRKISPLLVGGAQERSRRAGTENVPAIISLGLRARLLVDEKKLLSEQAELRMHTAALEDTLREIEQSQQTLRLHSQVATGLPNTIHFTIDPKSGLLGEDLLIELDLNGIAASSGSACSSGTNRPSQVLLASGLAPRRAANAVRISAGPGWTPEGFAHLRTTLLKALKKR